MWELRASSWIALSYCHNQGAALSAFTPLESLLLVFFSLRAAWETLRWSRSRAERLALCILGARVKRRQQPVICKRDTFAQRRRYLQGLLFVFSSSRCCKHEEKDTQRRHKGSIVSVCVTVWAFSSTNVIVFTLGQQIARDYRCTIWWTWATFWPGTTVAQTQVLFVNSSFYNQRILLPNTDLLSPPRQISGAVLTSVWGIKFCPALESTTERLTGTRADDLSKTADFFLPAIYLNPDLGEGANGNVANWPEEHFGTEYKCWRST